ncbi:hypothetical protein FNQ90_02440 [Streptomyces alkaliphilus]|uniref:Uncharacterized protein n=1 Tax=Streptomyces alkaliphilus TaxID=1472722 RepID=A0A7W3XZX0_9ACTN|nr:hypothetical protein [Streptomyces alkaliphilus]MBB0242994.1 hypothetical protein [Streptomyces alkaliphilus]
MIRVEWAFNMLSGPVVGSAEVPDQRTAAREVEKALRDALGRAWSSDHAGSVGVLSRLIVSADLSTGRWEHRATSVVVVLTPIAP